jgi:acyl-CoA synthetase (AMP-forming)/AMP-acid ligase II
VDRLHGTTVADVVREHRRRWPRLVALVDDRPGGAIRRTWPEVDDRANRAANALVAHGVGRGDVVLWTAQNDHRLLELLFACAKVGAVLVPANWRQTGDELAFVLEDCAPALVFWQDGEVGATVATARSRARARPARWVRIDAEPCEYEAFLSHDTTDPELDAPPEAAVLGIYTAAFAGRPNCALLPHQSLLTQALTMAMVARIDHEYVWLNSGPMFHIGTLMTTFATFLMGGRNVFLPRMDAESLCRIIDGERCTGAFVMGASVDQILEVNADGRWDLSSLRGGDPRLAGPDTSPWATLPGGYGQTEVNGMLTWTCLGAGGAGLHGRTGPLAQVRILDEDGTEVPPGEVGEIAARGPSVMVEYLDRPELNESRRAGGWHRTNDLGRREPDGSITFVGPKTRMIKSAAENIYPAEVENCLRTHAAVADVAVIGVPDARWVQSVKAVVVLRPGAAASAEDLIEHCRDRIASYKKPRTVEFVDALPRQGFAVDYDALDERFGGGAYPGGGTRSS